MLVERGEETGWRDRTAEGGKADADQGVGETGLLDTQTTYQDRALGGSSSSGTVDSAQCCCGWERAGQRAPGSGWGVEVSDDVVMVCGWPPKIPRNQDDGLVEWLE